MKKETRIKLDIYFQEELTESEAFEKLEELLKETPCEPSPPK